MPAVRIAISTELPPAKSNSICRNIPNISSSENSFRVTITSQNNLNIHTTTGSAIGRVGQRSLLVRRDVWVKSLVTQEGGESGR